MLDEEAGLRIVSDYLFYFQRRRDNRRCFENSSTDGDSDNDRDCIYN
jgi:hypothetical protein